MSAPGSNDRDYYADPSITGEVLDKETDFPSGNGCQEPLPAGGCLPGQGRGVRVSVKDLILVDL